MLRGGVFRGKRCVAPKQEESVELVVLHNEDVDVVDSRRLISKELGLP